MKLLWRMALGMSLLTSASIAMEPLKANIGSMGVRRALSTLPKPSSFQNPLWQAQRWRSTSGRPPKAKNRTQLTSAAAEVPSTTSEYADATIDTAFKEMMWRQDNDPVALSFINTFAPEIHATHVTFLKSAHLGIPPLKMRGKKQTFMDFHVTSDSGHHYIVEMQSQRHMRFDERALYYTCSTYANQIGSKDFEDSTWYLKLKPVIAIQVVDYDTNRIRGAKVEVKDEQGNVMKVIDPLDADFVKRARENPLSPDQAEKHFEMKCKHSGQTLDHLKLIQIELPRFNTTPLPDTEEEASDKDWWVRIMRYSDQYKKSDIEKLTLPAFVREALNRLDFSNWPPERIVEYKEDQVDRAKYSTVLQVERQEGKEEGLKEGEAKGELQKAQAIAKALIDKGMDDNFVTETTGLTLDQVQALRRGKTIQ